MTTLLLLAAIGLLLLSLTPRLPARPHALIDLPSHFPVQYCAAAVLLAPLALFFGAPVSAAIAACCFFITLHELRPLLPKGLVKSPDRQTLKILQVNVLKSNPVPGLLQKLILDEKPDIVTCCEVNPDFAAMLQGLKNDYPHRLITAGTDSYRVALLSKLPFVKIEQTAFGGARTEAIVFRVELNGRIIDAVSLHPCTPNANIKSRDSEFAAIADRFAAEKPERLMLIGDFNATPWCPAMKQLTRTLKLRNAREGRGINTTWPACLPFLFRIPIDHVLVSTNLGVASFGAMQSIGSDHLPTQTVIYFK
ncbi:MAG: endonuclease/exonuclease/phosphatase family protein [Alphaproteobacteria bacterium]|nr:MAG: endonuclease/exonuclease/phosphatase family protein [Alphaproteobacteria bacterium]